MSVKYVAELYFGNYYEPDTTHTLGVFDDMVAAKTAVINLIEAKKETFKYKRVLLSTERTQQIEVGYLKFDYASFRVFASSHNELDTCDVEFEVEEDETEDSNT